MCRARVAVRREVRAVAGKRGLPRGRAPGFMCNEAAEFRVRDVKRLSKSFSCAVFDHHHHRRYTGDEYRA